jgi:GMP synthase (glutamine-hydrolysing)
MAEAVGGRVVRSPEQGETGTHEVVLTEAGQQDPILAHLPVRFLAQQGHNDAVEEVPAPFLWLATSERCRWQGLKHPSKPFYGLQFHPELGREDFMVRMRKYAHEYASTPERFQEIDNQVKETTIQDVVEKFIGKIVLTGERH